MCSTKEFVFNYVDKDATNFGAWKQRTMVQKCGNVSNPADLFYDGETFSRLFSYYTIICQKVRDVYLFNVTKYSKTTSTHQNYLRKALEANGARVIELEDVPRGCADLRKELREIASPELAKQLIHTLNPFAAPQKL